MPFELLRRREIIDAARSCLDTPFHHQARVPGVGLDCIGLIVHAANCAGAVAHDFVRYSRCPSPKVLIRELSKSVEWIPIEMATPGAGLLIWIVKPWIPQHVAILTEDSKMIHTWDESLKDGGGRVVEHNYDDYWRERSLMAFEFTWQH